MDYLRPLLEENSEGLTHSTHLSSYIPFILDQGKEALGGELKGRRFVSHIFDGSAYQGEMLVILLRFSKGLQPTSVSVVAVIRDGTSLNEAAVGILKEIMHPNAANIICVANSLDNNWKAL